MPSNLEVRRVVEDEVETQIQQVDYDQKLSYKGYDAILKETADQVFDWMLDDMRTELSQRDREFIRNKVEQRVNDFLSKPTKPRFDRFERVVCKIGGERGWAPGTIQALQEDDPADVTGQTKLPYVVKIDPPLGRLISVPYDENTVCCPEVCYGQFSKADLYFTLRCKPVKQPKTRSFAVGDRVTCAVEDASCEYTIWSAGTVADVNYDVEPDAKEAKLEWTWTDGAGVVPYRVLLDSAVHSQQPAHVYVHRDEHWLVRDLALQPPGPRQSQDGTRNLKRFVKRRRDDSKWEVVDHVTRKVRIQMSSGEMSSDEDEGGAISVQ